MLSGSNRERLEQEIANLIDLISNGRKFFFQETGLSTSSSGEWFDHWKTKELFQKHLELRQLELNIQFLYIKLESYYKLIEDAEKIEGVKEPRLAFAHHLTQKIFGGKIEYNFFLHKVSENFKKVQIVFYDENPSDKELVRSIDLNLDKDINDFIKVWMDSNNSKGK